MPQGPSFTRKQIDAALAADGALAAARQREKIERYEAALAGIVEWSVDHADAKRRAQNALKR